MATSLTMQRDTIIQLALELVRAVPVGTTPSTALVSSAANMLSVLIKELDAEYSISEKITMFQTSANVALNDTYVTLASDIEYVLAAYFEATDGSPKIPLKPMALRQMMEARGEAVAAATDEMWYAVSKTDAGTDTAGNAVTAPVMFLYPSVPEAGKVWYWARKKIDLFDNATDTNDLPAEFLRYTIFQLAADICVIAGGTHEQAKLWESKADKSFQRLVQAQAMEYRRQITDRPAVDNDKDA